jgi:hypothetical protein
MPLFLFVFHIFITYIHSFNYSYIHTIHLSIAIRQGLSPFPHRLYAQWERPPCGAEPRIELGSALQQADVLPTEPRRNKLSHAAPKLSHAAPKTEPRRTPTEPRRTPTEPRRTPTEPRRTQLSPCPPSPSPIRTHVSFSFLVILLLYRTFT